MLLIFWLYLRVGKEQYWLWRVTARWLQTVLFGDRIDWIHSSLLDIWAWHYKLLSRVVLVSMQFICNVFDLFSFVTFYLFIRPVLHWLATFNEYFISAQCDIGLVQRVALPRTLHACAQATTRRYPSISILAQSRFILNNIEKPGGLTGILSPNSLNDGKSNHYTSSSYVSTHKKKKTEKEVGSVSSFPTSLYLFI